MTPRLLIGALAGLAALAVAPAAAIAGPAQQLANRYAPVVALVDQKEPCARGEPWRPTTVDIVLGNPEVTLRSPATGHPVVEHGPTAADIFDKGDGFYLEYPGNPNIPGCTYDRDGKRFARGKPSIAYAHLVTGRSPEDGPALALQYWFFYYFNDYNDKHEADWEGIQLVFRAGSARAALERKPVEVGYAQHLGGESADWDSDKVEKVGTHPVVYSAAGSHASYYSSALWLGKSASEGVGCDDTRAPTHQIQLDAVVVPGTVESRHSPYAWLAFEGRWGQKLPGANNGPSGPNTKDRWTDPFAWQEGLRGSSIATPVGGTLGPSVTGAFCGAVAVLSSMLTFFYESPAWTIVGLALLIALVVGLTLWLIRRTTWTPPDQERLRRQRSIGEILRSAWRVYWKRRTLFLGLGLLAVVVFVLVRVIEELLHLALSPFGDVTINMSATAFSAFAVTAAVAIAADRIDRGRPVRVLGTYRLTLGKALPLLGAIVLEALLLLAVFVLVVLFAWLLSLVDERAGTVAIIASGLFLVWWLATVLVGFALTPQEVCIDGRSGPAVVRNVTRVVRRNWWRSAVLLVVLYVISVAAGPLVGFAVLFLVGLDPVYIDLIGSSIYVILFPYVAISATLLYFDLEARRKERAAPVGAAVPA